MAGPRSAVGLAQSRCIRGHETDGNDQHAEWRNATYTPGILASLCPLRDEVDLDQRSPALHPLGALLLHDARLMSIPRQARKVLWRTSVGIRGGAGSASTGCPSICDR